MIPTCPRRQNENYLANYDCHFVIAIFSTASFRHRCFIKFEISIGPAGLCRPPKFSLKLALRACVDLGDSFVNHGTEGKAYLIAAPDNSAANGMVYEQQMELEARQSLVAMA